MIDKILYSIIISGCIVGFYQFYLLGKQIFDMFHVKQ